MKNNTNKIYDTKNSELKNPKHQLRFWSTDFTEDFKTLLIIGACRSGKTLLGNILAMSSKVEYSEEPWFLMLAPMVAGLGLMDKDLAGVMFKVYTSELMNDMILLRQANFRPNDQSSIWTKKTKKEIYHRLHRLQSRVDVARYIQKVKPVLVCTLPETQAFTDLLNQWISPAGIIHVVRNGHAVAHEIETKQWFSDRQLKMPQNAQIYRPFRWKSEQWYLPWWVEYGHEQPFLKSSDYERGLYYWCVMTEQELGALSGRSHGAKNMQICYEQFVTYPEATLKTIGRFLQIPINDRMRKSLLSIDTQYLSYPRPNKVRNDLLLRGDQLLGRLGY